jgi:hypothetical protein
MADFGITVTRPNRSTFTAIFDNEYVAVGDVPVESAAPSLTCRSTDVATVAAGDELAIDGTDYVVRSIQPDGAGITVLRLERA